MEMKQSLPDAVRRKALKLFERSGMTMEELGLKMGYPVGTARRAIWQLFNKVDDPRLSTVEKLAEALGCQPKDLL
jgi:transcriptional regulator with XRE-family HTH domain